MIEANQDKNPNSLEIGDCLHIPAADDNEWMEPSWSEPSRGNSCPTRWHGLLRAQLVRPLVGENPAFHHGLDIA